MNILLLGNGFDLYHEFPTKYSDFLHTVNYLMCYYTPSMKTVGDIFSARHLQGTDPFIARCYRRHKDVYDEIVLPPNAVREIQDSVKNSKWFSYLSNSFDKDVGWIDFESEIAMVLGIFHNVLSRITVEFSDDIFSSKVDRYIIGNFPFYKAKDLSKIYQDGEFSDYPASYMVDEEFRVEYPFQSGNWSVKTDQIIQNLYDDLVNVSTALKLYLKYFVEAPLSEMKKAGRISKCDALLHIDNVVTLNYTNTYEKLYSNNSVFHLHGSVDGNIILGVNADLFDEINEFQEIDTSMISFKKYYQKALYETDIDYLHWKSDIADDNYGDIHLLIMGHSLDVTDKDIIVELFDMASKITILYHSFEAKNQYMRNLVRLFGKHKFDFYRNEKALSFLPLDMDFTDFAKKQEANSCSAYQHQMEQLETML